MEKSEKETWDRRFNTHFYNPIAQLHRNLVYLKNTLVRTYGLGTSSAEGIRLENNLQASALGIERTLNILQDLTEGLQDTLYAKLE